MPELHTYYRATHLGRLIDWCRHTTSKLWTQLEQAQSATPIHRIPWCYIALPTDLKRHPLIGNTARVCAHLIDSSSLFSRNSPLKPILGNPLFEPGVGDGGFRELREEGLFQASHFSNRGRWKTITELSDPEGQFRLDFLRALQLHHFLSSMPPPNDTDQTLTPMEDLCSGTGPLLHSLSLTYSMLITQAEEYKLQGLTKWEKELKCQFTTSKKQHILQFTHKSLCTKIQETNYKILTHWYRTPALLNTIFPLSSDVCWRCQERKGTLLHIFWSCSWIQNFWREVRQLTQKFTDRVDPAYFLLHANDTPTRIYKKSVVRHLLDAAKTCIPLFWKSTQTPTIALWLQKVEEINQMEDLILTSQNRQETYTKTWQLWNMFKYSEEGQALRGR